VSTEHLPCVSLHSSAHSFVLFFSIPFFLLSIPSPPTSTLFPYTTLFRSLYHNEVSYQEPMLMFRNLGAGKFAKTSESLGPDFVRPIAGRGLAIADYDNDGDIDIITNNRGGYPSLLRNDGGSSNHWLTVKLIGTRSNRDGIGSSLKLSSEGFVHVEQAKGGMSYMSASDPRIHFGLGKRTKIDFLEVAWASGQVDRLTSVPVDQIIAVKEGTGIVPRKFPKIVN